MASKNRRSSRYGKFGMNDLWAWADDDLRARGLNLRIVVVKLAGYGEWQVTAQIYVVESRQVIGTGSTPYPTHQVQSLEGAYLMAMNRAYLDLPATQSIDDE